MRIKALSALMAVMVGSTGAISFSSPSLMLADANGDQLVDILDLQLVIAAALNQKEAAARADVNGDGRVDVLDFQYILQQAQAQSPDQQSTPPGRDTATIVLSRGQQPGTPATVRPISLITQGKRVATAALRARSVPLTIHSPKEERYIFQLMPNAPPAQEECVRWMPV